MTHFTDDEAKELLRLCDAAKENADASMFLLRRAEFDLMEPALDAIPRLLKQLEELRADGHRRETRALMQAQDWREANRKAEAERDQALAREAKLREALKQAIKTMENVDGENDCSRTIKACLAALKEGHPHD
jgi:hypothetical protein